MWIDFIVQPYANFLTPNCIDHQLRVPSGFNIELWEHYLSDNWDQQLIFFIKYGFLIDIQAQQAFQPCTVTFNHASARAYPQAVHKYIDTEKESQAILGLSNTSNRKPSFFLPLD